LDWKHYFAVENIQVIAEGEVVNHSFLRLEQYILFCSTIMHLRSMAFKVDEISYFYHTLKKTESAGRK
jgi:hypothetical protein